MRRPVVRRGQAADGGRAAPRRAAVWVAALVALGGLGRGARAAGPGGPDPAAARVLAVGKVAFDGDLVTEVTSPVAGRVTRVLAKVGERVQAGTPLAVISSPELEHVVPDKLEAEADLAAAAGEVQRQRQLFDAREGVTERLEAAQAQLARARARAERARARAALVKSLDADEMTGSFTLTAPRAGVVLASAAVPGAALAGPGPLGGGAVAFTVGTERRVWVVARIAAGEAARVFPGARVTAQAPERPGRTFAGRVTRIGPPGPELRESTVRCEVGNPGDVLRPGMAATLAIAVR
jgi:multidrug efflux pump subunit AcrA (membrane-fusion protein)